MEGKASKVRPGGAAPTGRTRERVIVGITGVVALLLAGCSAGGGASDSSRTQSTGLSVTPETAFKINGSQGGPFTPASKDYTLENKGTAAIDWSASSFAQEPWLVITPTSGTLAPGDQATVTLSLEPTQVASLTAGIYPTVVDFVNETNGEGNTSRDVNLSIGAVTGLDVTPLTGLDAFGTVGGPFSPSSKTYTLKNSTGSPIDWTASADKAWVSLSKTSGTLAAGGQTSVIVSIVQPSAASFALGSYSATVTFANATNGAGDTTRDVNLDVMTPGSSGTASSLSQFGITWDFDQPYTVGQFTNGDWWVVGPVTIIGITPHSSDVGGRTMNGSMVNPTAGILSQGYDSEMFGIYNQPGYYDPNLNVALDVSPSKPLVLTPGPGTRGKSLISTISNPTAGNRPQLVTAAVLTVLSSPPPAGSFRPPYCGPDKAVRFNDSNLDPNGLLHSLDSSKVAHLPELGQVERMFERPWIDHIPLWYGPSYMHPTQNLPDYGRDIADEVGWASLMLNLDFTPAQKRTLLIRFVQVGIDFWGVLQNGGITQWQSGAGFNHGRKWPILFAGLMLDDPDMSGVGLDPTYLFQGEDGQTFYVQETSPGVYNNGYGGYGPQNVGMPEWGIKHSTFRPDDSISWTAPYRECCTANAWYGELLAARIMGVKALWNHDALFDYEDRFLQTTRNNGSPHWVISWSRFPLEMWDLYRSQF